MTRRALLLVSAVLAGGCRTLLGIDEAIVGDGGMGGAEGLIDVLDAGPGCYGVPPFETCVPGVEPMTTTIALDDMVLDTSDVRTCSYVDMRDGRDWCVLAAKTISVTGVVRTFGARPLVLLGTETLTLSVTGIIDVASHRQILGQQPGAAANPPTCSSSVPGDNNNTGGSGGGGGSFATRGGRGGNGATAAVAGGISGSAVNGLPNTLRGGCAGGEGGAGGGSTIRAVAGPGGGAVYLLAGTRLDLAGTIDASGAGASGGAAPLGGGAGGGSGGMIVLWSPMVELSTTGALIANGGGGGGGADGMSNGWTGQDPDPSSALAAPGGQAGGPGGGTGRGGNGSTGVSTGQDGFSGTGNSGGGGGGGGAGAIRVISGQSLTGNLVSPPPST